MEEWEIEKAEWETAKVKGLRIERSADGHFPLMSSWAEGREHLDQGQPSSFGHDEHAMAAESRTKEN